MTSSSAALTAWLWLVPLPGGAPVAPRPQPAVFAEADELRSRGDAAGDRQALQEAASRYREGLGGLRADDLRAYAHGWDGLGQTLSTLGQAQEALQALQQALSYWERLDDPSATAATLVRVGAARLDVGAHQEAIDSLSRGLEIHRRLQDRRGEATALHHLGMVYYRRGDTDRALSFYREALERREAEGEAVPAANTRHNIAALLAERGEHRQAVGEYERCLEVFRQAGSAYTEARVLHNLGRSRLRLGETLRGLEVLEQARDRAASTGDQRMVAYALSGAAIAYATLGRYERALESLEQALGVFRQIGDPTGQGSSLLNLGERYASLTDWPQARARFDEALALARKHGERRHEAWALYGLGLADAVAGRLPAARASLAEGQSLARATKTATLEARILSTLGEVDRLAGERAKARESLLAALTLYETLEDRGGQALVQEKLGHLELDERSVAGAVDRWTQALGGYRRVGDRGGEAEVLYQLARAEASRDLLEAATARAREALDLVESLRGAVPGSDLRVSYLASKQDLYELYVDLLLRGGLATQAFEASERARARGLLDSVTEARRGPGEEGAPGLRSEEALVREKLNSWEHHRMRLLREGGRESDLQAVEREIDGLVSALQDLRRRIWEAGPRSAALERPVPSFDEIRRHALDDDTVLLEFALGAERSYVFVATRQGVEAQALPPRRQVDEAARRMWGLVNARGERLPFETASARQRRIASADREYPQAAAALARMILAPVAARLTGRRLLVVPHGALQYVPFAALPKPAAGRQRPLIADHEIVVVPAASVLVTLRRSSAGHGHAGGDLLVFADPVFEPDDPRVAGARPAAAPADDLAHRAAAPFTSGRIPRLPRSREEAQAILALVPPERRRQALDFDATRAAATSPDLGRYRVLHFATHGFVDSERPELSGLVLSLVDRQGRAQDGFLRLYDVSALDVQADLVVLNACQTALGREVRGEGLVGLAGGFLNAGARSVLASLWNTSDRAAAEVVTGFYRALLKEGRGPAAALRSAQLRARVRWPHPYFWAGLTLQGDGR